MSDQATLEILIKIREDLAGLTKAREGLSGMRGDVEKLTTSFKQGLGIGTGMEIARRGVDLLARSLNASVGESFRLAESIKDQSEALGVSAEAYQVLNYELRQAGVDAARLTIAVSSQTNSLAQARAGASSAAEAYRTLGLSISQVEQLTPEKRLEVVARAVLNATDQTKAFQAAGQILGTRGLPQLLNGLRSLATDGYDRVRDAAKAAGVVMGDDTIAILDRAKKQIDNFQQTTLPVATGTLIGWAQSAMSGLGAAAGNALNFFQGMPSGTFEGPTLPAPPKPTGPSFASARDVLPIRIGINNDRASNIQSNSLMDEAGKRRALIPILNETIDLYRQLGEAEFGKGWEQQLSALQRKADLTDAEKNSLKDMWDLENKIRGVKKDRLENIETPLGKVAADLNDTATFTAQTLAGGLSSAVSGLSGDIIAAAHGTQSWGQAFRNLGQTAGSILQQIIARMLVVQAINAALGIFGFGLGGSGGIVKLGASTATMGSSLSGVKAAGGGRFITNGPTNFTVGDNPGGAELVSVIPLSGVGQSTVNGQAIRMAGGGSALVNGGGGGGDTFNFGYTFNGGVSRQEVLAMMPMMIESTKSAVLDAKRRRRDGFR